MGADGRLGDINGVLGNVGGARWPTFLARGAAFVVVFIALDWSTFVFNYRSLGYGITPWNPATGLAVAVVLAWGPASAVWLFIAALAAELVTRAMLAGPAASAMTAAVFAASYGGCAAILYGSRAWPTDLDSLRGVVIVLGAALFAAIATAVGEIGVLVAHGLLAANDFRSAALRLCVGDFIGVATVTPLALRVLTAGGIPRVDAPVQTIVFSSIVGAAILAAAWIAFGLESTDQFKFFYLLFPPVIASALRYGVDGACLSVLATQIAMISLTSWRGYSGSTATELVLVMLVLTGTGLIVGVVVAERRRADRAFRDNERRLRENQAQLSHFSRLSLTGEMASALAHELNQPLTAIRNYTRAARRLLDAPSSEVDGARAVMERAIAQVDLAGGIIQRLRNFVRKGETRRTALAIDGAIDEVTEFMRSEAGLARVELRQEVAAGLPAAAADPVQIQQVLLNLVRNAMDAMKERPETERRIVLRARLADAGGAIVVEVADSGPGVPAAMSDQLFVPFSTTKATGLGLGLSISRSIVAAHGGELRLAANGPNGAVFSFTLPAHATGARP